MHAIGIDMSKDTFYAAFDEREVRKFENTEDGIEEFMTAIDPLKKAPEEPPRRTSERTVE